MLSFMEALTFLPSALAAAAPNPWLSVAKNLSVYLAKTDLRPRVV